MYLKSRAAQNDQWNKLDKLRPAHLCILMRCIEPLAYMHIIRLIKCHPTMHID